MSRSEKRQSTGQTRGKSGSASKARGKETDPNALDLGSQKLYFKIGEVAEIVGVAPHVLRYWETEFRAIRPQKSRSQQRVYRRRDVETLLKVKHLLYEQKFTIAGARQQLESGAGEIPFAAPSDAYRVRRSLAQVQAQLDVLLEMVRSDVAVDPVAADPARYVRDRGGAKGLLEEPPDGAGGMLARPDRDAQGR